ncbi:flagellar biosynthetic protein flip [Thalassobacter stenotrophicus]|uniref:flagellar type III secretion system pore protein FliP n=1 Tax=Thalassobacter TaxID=266808 RepID=UPI00051D0F2A|nr:MULTISPECIES: flagellar type III secretion system pore protein FliP [Thalassobacter]KGK79378.1 flagellar biosynthetic protein flip [Thalassobacter stenotrophicus]KGL01671.1 flagellar biosynthetic protein flip [Thalassobacter sp. 16PALIMAR09]
MRALLTLIFCLAIVAPANAQEIAISLGEENALTARTLQLIALITVLSLAPGLAIMVTCFPFIVTVLSILRQAIGLQQSPPNMLIVSLALFLTYFVMEPVFTSAWQNGLSPLVEGTMDIGTAFGETMAPFQVFMGARVDPETLDAMIDMRTQSEEISDQEPPLSVLVPAFLLSEISRAFQIGFLVFLPFLIIDMVVAAILMSMGMMMVPPAVVALPFKLAFFVVADGWTLVTSALVRSYF